MQISICLVFGKGSTTLETQLTDLLCEILFCGAVAIEQVVCIYQLATHVHLCAQQQISTYDKGES